MTSDSAFFAKPPDCQFTLPNGGSHDHTFLLEHGGKIRGKVVLEGAPAGEPLPLPKEGLHLACAPEYRGSIEVSTPYESVDIDIQTGEYLTPPVLPGTYFLFLISGGGDARYEQSSKYETAVARAGEIVEGPIITIRRYTLFTGRCVNANGGALTEQPLEVAFQNKWLVRSMHTVTDAEGGFRIDLPMSVQWADFRISGRQPVRKTAAEILDAAAASGNLGTIAFQEGARLWGRVVDAEGKPVNGARVTAEKADTREQKKWTTAFYEPAQTHSTKAAPADVPGARDAGEDGWFDLANVPFGETQLSVEAGQGSAALQVTVDYAGPIGPLELRLSSSGTVNGTLAWPDGSPAADLDVGAYSAVTRDNPLPAPLASGRLPFGSVAGARTNERGQFQFPRLPRERHMLIAQVRKEGKAYRAMSPEIDLREPGASARGLRLMLVELPNE